ncbi:uncharacterized protein [Leptinotarsa decemlineata]|uniref:uncharacterized protein n=1 Tax=Leptinotarsa decemlineata TaxID=7539 RepID=UPI003D30A132
MTIRRFISQHGCPREIYSDNGMNMYSANIELGEAVKDMDGTEILFFFLKNITWKLIPQVSPHMGGSWERLVRLAENVLSITLKERHPKEEVLITLIAEAEDIINSRPLSYISNDPLETESLTPNHF